jgi:uncharacterized protein YjbI with pentapeptide repeats
MTRSASTRRWRSLRAGVATAIAVASLTLNVLMWLVNRDMEADSRTVAAITASSRQDAWKAELAARFTQASSLLDSKDPNVRVGGVYALGELASDDPGTYSRKVVSLLSVLLADNVEHLTSAWHPATEDPSRVVERPDVHAQLREWCTLGDKLSGTDDWVPFADLRSADLAGCDLRGPSLYGTDFRGAKLEGAVMSGTHLEAVDLTSASLDNAVLTDADFLDVDLAGATLSGTDFRRARIRSLVNVRSSGTHLEQADLQSADLRHAVLEKAHFDEAILRDARMGGLDAFGGPVGPDLRGASFRGADLTNADLRDTSLQDVDITAAIIRGADLRGADLSLCHGLTLHQINSAVMDGTTILPAQLLRASTARDV